MNEQVIMSNGDFSGNTSHRLHHVERKDSKLKEIEDLDHSVNINEKLINPHVCVHILIYAHTEV